MLSEAWWLKRTAPKSPSSGISSDMIRWQLAQVAHDLLWRWHTPLGVVPSPIKPSEGFEPLVVISPQCLRSPASFAVLDDETMGWTCGLQLDDLPVVLVEPGSPRALSDVEARKAFFAALKLEQHLKPGHEKCFHRRAKDISPVMWTIALLIRTHNGRAWSTDRTWDTIIDARIKHEPWSAGLDGGWTNGHSLSAYYEAMNTPPERRTYNIADVGPTADGRAIVVYEWGDPTGTWPAVVLQNDGLAFIRGERIDIGARWRAGDDITSLAAELAGRARLPVRPPDGP